MTVPPAAPLSSARLRAAPCFRLVSLEEASAAESIPLAAGGSGWAGALVPREPGWRRAHLLSRETADLLATLQRPAPAPGDCDPAAVARLVLDGILEMEHDKAFVSGPEAHPLFFAIATPMPQGAIARLSLEALQCTAASGRTKAPALAEALYRYHTLPASPQWRRQFPNAKAVARLLTARGVARRRSAWTTFVSAKEHGPAWEVWERSGAAMPALGAPTCKLYVTPPVANLEEARGAVLDLAGARGAPFAFKLGYDLPTLLRSDCLVAYFVTRDELYEGAERLQKSLSGMAGHGVPFTAELHGGPLLSWGADPGDLAEPPGPLRQSSWRRWITARLAAALASALAAGSPVPAWHYALDRLSLDGVDPRNWIPPAWFWNSSARHADH